MAQSGYTPILIYGSGTASSVPSASNLTSSSLGVELALNYTDGKLYYKDNTGTVQLLASKAAATGVLSFQTSLSGLTPSTATNGAVTLAGTLGAASGGTGATTLTGYVYGNGTSAMTASTTIPNTSITGLGTMSTQNANSVAITGGSVNGTTIGASTASTGAFTTLSASSTVSGTGFSTYLSSPPAIGNTAANTGAFTTLTNTGTAYLGLSGGAGTQSLQVTPVASAVNYWNAQGSTTGGGVQLLAQGSDTNISAYYAVKGSGNHIFWDNLGSTQFVVARTASTVNYLQVTGGTTGNAPLLIAQGSDTNIPITLQTKGTGSYYIYGGGAYFYNNSSAPQFAVTSTASAVNYLQVSGGATGNAVAMSAQGSDTNINLQLVAKGTGYVQAAAAYSPTQTLTDAATIAWNTASGQVAIFTFVSSNRTMGAPTNLQNGAFYALEVVQNAGSNTLTWNSVFKWAGGVAPTLSTAAGAKDFFIFRSDGTNLYQQGISQAVA